MKKLIRSKWLIIILLMIAMVVFNGLIFNVSVINRSVVIGIGIDYEDGEYMLTTQIILPKNGGVTSGGNNYVCYFAKNKDIEVAIDKIEKEHGTTLSFAQATMLMLGEEMVKYGDINVVTNFFIDDKVHDNLQLAMVEGKAIEIMQSNVPAGEVACLQIVKQLRPPKAQLGISAVALQEFVRDIEGNDGVAYLPIVKRVKTSPSVEQGKDKVEEADKFEVNTTAIVTKEGYKGKLDDKMTMAFTLVKFSLQEGVLSVQNDDNSFSVTLISSTCTKSYDFNKKQYKLSLKLITTRSEARSEGNTISFKLSCEEEQKLNQTIFQMLESVIDYGKQINVDILHIAEGFYKFNPKYETQIKNKDFLQEVQLKLNIKLTQR